MEGLTRAPHGAHLLCCVSDLYARLTLDNFCSAYSFPHLLKTLYKDGKNHVVPRGVKKRQKPPQKKYPITQKGVKVPL